MGIYQESIKAVENGARFLVDFSTKTLKINKKTIINNGVYDGELGVSLCSEQECLSQIEGLYIKYKHSQPSERSESKSHKYFKALPESELDDEDMLFGCQRDVAQIALELYVLCQILNGFKWSETMGKWFWQSDADKDLILLKKWIEN